jgi:hypothetical protein
MQIHAFEVTVLPGDEDGDRPVVVAIDVEGGEGALEDARLNLELLGVDGGLLRELFDLHVGVIQPGRQLKIVRTWTRLVAPATQARWSLAAESRVWRGPVRALSASATAAPPADPPVPPQPLRSAAVAAPQAAPRPSRSWSPAPAPLPRADTPPPPPAPPPETRWTRAAEGDLAVVAEEFEGTSLDMDGRDRVRDMLRSDDPVQLELGCRICAATGWRTAAQNMRRLLSHDKKEVRVAAAEAIGKLAGPAMEHYLKPLVQDPNKEVRAAALTAIARLAQS